MLGLNLEKLIESAEHGGAFQNVGSLRSVQGTLTAELHAEIGELCEIHTANANCVLGEVIGFRDNIAQILPFRNCDRLRSGDTVYGLGRRLSIPVGTGLLGRVIDGLGQPIDGKGKLNCLARTAADASSPPALDRPRISKPLRTGIKVVDAFLTLGLGQRMALLAGSGVGKSTLLGEIAKGSNADVNVVALIGERGREVRPFIDDCLGEEGLAKSVVVVATADEQPLLRIRAANAALSIADYFRESGCDVLFLLDSITRMATSQREIGLMLGEPPTARGYTPSVFQMMSDLLERMGNSDRGSISSIISVLVDGDDLDEPITDSVRSIVDGHVVLDRELAQHGRFPAVSIGKSLSRVFRDVTVQHHQDAATKVRDALATFTEVEDLVRVGVYANGNSYRIDKAIQLKTAIDDFVKQGIGERSSFTDTVERLCQLAAQWDD